MGIVYLAFNEVTEKCYVGQTIVPLSTRWTKHRSQALHGRPTRIGKAIRKHGSESFSLQVLAEPKSKESLNNTEKLWIILLNTTNEHFGYNITAGGESVVVTTDGIEKMKARLTGRTLSEEHRKRIGKASRQRWSDPEYKIKLSKTLSTAALAKPKSELHKQRMSEGRKGMKLSASHIQHIQEGRRRFFQKQKENSHAAETN